MTSSPTLKFVTAVPVRVTTPEHSKPIFRRSTHGKPCSSQKLRSTPQTWSTSLKLSPAARTAISSSLGSGARRDAGLRISSSADP